MQLAYCTLCALLSRMQPLQAIWRASTCEHVSNASCQQLNKTTVTEIQRFGPHEKSCCSSYVVPTIFRKTKLHMHDVRCTCTLLTGGTSCQVDGQIADTSWCMQCIYQITNILGQHLHCTHMQITSGLAIFKVQAFRCICTFTNMPIYVVLQQKHMHAKHTHIL